MVSAPAPPLIVSLPVPPFSVSLPVPPTMAWENALPVSVNPTVPLARSVSMSASTASV